MKEIEIKAVDNVVQIIDEYGDWFIFTEDIIEENNPVYSLFSILLYIVTDGRWVDYGPKSDKTQKK